MSYRLYARPGWGSVIVETQLIWYQLPFERVLVDDLFESESARSALAAINPLAQLPTLVLPDGQVMTESAAITLHLADVAAAVAQVESLVPMAPGATRNDFLRWLVFIIANLYPTFTYADEPTRFVEDAQAAVAFRNAVDAYAQARYADLEAIAGAPWFLGDAFSALDIYIATLAHWRPGRSWFASQVPKLDQIARRCVDLQPLRSVWAENFSG